MTEEVCKYCEGKGYYNVERFGLKEKEHCRFCGGKGTVSNES